MYEYFETADFLYLVLEHCGAGTIRTYVCSTQHSGLGLPEDEARRLFVDICYALSHCHQQGIVHRSVVMVVVCDYGGGYGGANICGGVCVGYGLH